MEEPLKGEKIKFTFHGKHDSHVDLGLGVDLALVDASVAWLDVVDLEVPVVRWLRVKDAEPRVTRVREDMGGQDVQVAFSHP